MIEGHAAQKLLGADMQGGFSGRFRASAAPTDTPETRRLLAAAIAGVEQGDHDAFRLLYIRYAGSVYGYVKSILRDEHEAEDVTQQVFAKLPSIVHKYEARDVSFSAWILRVAHNAAIDDMRRRRAVPVEEVRLVETGTEELRRDRYEDLIDAMTSLPEDQREVVYLRHVIGLSPGEIAERLGKSESSIHGLHHRGRGALRAALQALDSSPSTAAVG
jgi:RNA polymerase sigma-70 factor, ECF subfamily